MLTIKDIIEKRMKLCSKQLRNLSDLDYDQKEHIGGLKSVYEEMFQDAGLAESSFFSKYNSKAKRLQEMLQENRDDLEELDGKLQGVLDILQLYDPEYTIEDCDPFLNQFRDTEEDEQFYGRYY